MSQGQVDNACLASILSEAKEASKQHTFSNTLFLSFTAGIMPSKPRIIVIWKLQIDQQRQTSDGF